MDAYREIVLPLPVLNAKTAIGPNGLIVYVCLAEAAYPTRETSVSYDILQEMTGLSRSVISHALDLLVTHGLITKQRRFSKSTIYTLVHIMNFNSSSSSTTERLINTTTINSSIKSSEVELMNYSSSENELLATGEKNTARMTDTEEAIYVFQQVTGMVAIPGQDRDRRITELGGLVRMHGVDGAIEKLKPCWAEWQKRKGKNGRGYSRLNPGWIEWAVADEIPNKNGAHREEVFIDV